MLRTYKNDCEIVNGNWTRTNILFVKISTISKVNSEKVIFSCNSLNQILFSWRKLRPSDPSSRHKPSKRFLYYSLVSWGIPSFITGTALGIDMSSLTSYDILKPNFGMGSCWFNGKGVFQYDVTKWIHKIGLKPVWKLRRYGIEKVEKVLKTVKKYEKSC